MPRLKIERILSFSSEDKVHVAENILNDTNKKWKCQNPGEKNATIILKLSQPTKITGIDIGNEHSAFVEVFVGRSTFTDDQYKVLLMTSSFMTPMDSRESRNINRMRMFTTNDFCKPTCDERWDCVKIVCTQPFNRHVQYGLSCVTIHGANETESSTEASEENSTKVKKLGKFLVREESPEDNLSPGSVFNKRNDKEPLSVAATIRKASKESLASVSNQSQSSSSSSSKVLKKSPTVASSSKISRNSDRLLYDDEDDTAHSAVKKRLDLNDKKENITPQTPQPSTSKPKVQKHPRSPPPDPKPVKKAKKVKTKPFHKLFEDVVFAISGYQNPGRADMRRKAIEMGAKYKPDWDSSCTHLICAFKNTPKYNEVNGNGIIVTSTWINECYASRKRLPWRRFALSSRLKVLDDSEDEIVAEDSVLDDEEDVSERRGNYKKFNVESSGSDTEDEIERIRNKENQTKRTEPSPQPENNDNDTEPEVMEGVEDSDQPFEKLPNFFEGIKFYMPESLSDDEKKYLNQHIIAAGGKLIEDLALAKYALVNNLSSVAILKNKNPNISTVKFNWIEECYENKQLIDVEPFLV